MIPTDWWKNFFSGVVVEMWLAFPTDEMIRAEADFLVKTLRLSPGAKVLDVPCGGGRHSLELAARGCHMTGVDVSPDFLKAARAQAAEKQRSVVWEQREMRDLPWRGAFDAAFCYGNSFGYLDDEGNAQFLHAVARALKPKARFVLDMGAVAEALLPSYQERRWYPIGDILFLVQNHHDLVHSRIDTEYIFVRDGKVEKRMGSQRIYTYGELSRLFEAAGFTELEGYGSLDQEPFRLGSQRLLLAAMRRGD